MRGNLRATLWRLAVFLTVCGLGTFALLAVFAQFRFGGGKNYSADFTNVTGLKEGDFVRIAGVEVGKVGGIKINRDATVHVEFSAKDAVTLTEGTRAIIRYDNVIGGRSRRGRRRCRDPEVRINHSRGPHRSRAGS